MSALGIGVDLVFKRVPPALLEEARERAFPVLAVPLGTAVPRHRRLHQPLAALQRPAHLPAAERDPAPPRRRAARAAPARGDGRAPGADARRRRADARARRATSRSPAGRCPTTTSRPGRRARVRARGLARRQRADRRRRLARGRQPRPRAGGAARPARRAGRGPAAGRHRPPRRPRARPGARGPRSACSTRRWRARATSARWPRGRRRSALDFTAPARVVVACDAAAGNGRDARLRARRGRRAAPRHDARGPLRRARPGRAARTSATRAPGSAGPSSGSPTSRARSATRRSRSRASSRGRSPTRTSTSRRCC